MNEDRDDDVQRRPGHMYDPAAPLPEHLKPAPEAPLLPGRLKDVDSADVAFRIKAFAIAGWLGILGMFVGMLMSIRFGFNPLIAVPLGFIIGTATAGSVALVVAGTFGGIGSRLYMPGGGSMPPARQYSLGDSLVARGRYVEAAAEFERAAAKYPHDPIPCLRLARLLRDSLERPEDSVRWLRQAITRRECDAAAQALAIREIVEVFSNRLQQPERALPDLARLADAQAGTPAGEWARREMADIRQAMRERGQP